MELNPLSFELVLICPRSSDSGADLLVLSLFDTFPYSHFDPLLKRAYPHCIVLYCLNENIFAMDWGPTADWIPPNLDWWLNEEWNRVHWMIYISMDSSVEWFFHNWILCLSPQRMTFATSTRRWLLKWRMSGIQVPKRNLQTHPWSFRCRCFSKHSNSINE